MTSWRVAAAMLLGIGLVGCSGPSTPAAGTTVPATTVASTTSQTTASSPSASQATEKQVASIIAGSEKLWRQVADEGGTCRMNFLMKDSRASAHAERLVCYTNELTAGLTAQTAIKELNALSIPASMQSLVKQTKDALEMMVTAKLQEACGPAMTEPKETSDCNAALGTRYTSYTLLETILDKWKPYL